MLPIWSVGIGYTDYSYQLTGVSNNVKFKAARADNEPRLSNREIGQGIRTNAGRRRFQYLNANTWSNGVLQKAVHSRLDYPVNLIVACLSHQWQ